MKRLVTVDEMRWCDEMTIRNAGVPGLLLMEHAGAGVVNIIRRYYSPLGSKHVVVCCGKGNNGGDGFVVARLLSQYCRCITVLVLPKNTELKGDALSNYRILRSYARVAKNITITQYSRKGIERLQEVDLFVDAIFGTGFSGEVQQQYADVIRWMNSVARPIVAVDIPSGVNGTTGCAAEPAIRATHTVTFGFIKTGLLCNAGRELSGTIHCIDIGIPSSLAQHASLKYSLIEQSDVRNLLPQRSQFAHKYSVGKVLVIAGSRGLTGAAAMCSLTAFRSGVGAVVLVTPDVVYPILAKKLTEVMVHPLPSTDAGTIDVQAMSLLEEKLQWADVVIVGPGLGQHQNTQQCMLTLLTSYKGKIVIDADGLNMLARARFQWLNAKAQLILTPHVGEFSRLLGLNSSVIEKNRMLVAQQFAQENNLILILKGVPTVTASPTGEVVVNSSGNPGMATAGAGDILAGLVGGLWAQGMLATEAAACAVYIHGVAGDIAAKNLGARSMLATDILRYIPKAITLIERGIE
ncbi:MAG: NAD(P)H-hydrate dehydratase [Bacteroidetes bacterium]|nr:NAD(P)H-hydrate dehydratase [Bacteroidota bacterium]